MGLTTYIYPAAVLVIVSAVIAVMAYAPNSLKMTRMQIVLSMIFGIVAVAYCVQLLLIAFDIFRMGLMLTAYH